MNERIIASSTVTEDDVQGFAPLNCNQAISRAQGYIALGNVLMAFGDSAGAAGYYGRAQGVIEGGCGK